jgi:hypothetical protein
MQMCKLYNHMFINSWKYKKIMTCEKFTKIIFRFFKFQDLP